MEGVRKEREVSCRSFAGSTAAVFVAVLALVIACLGMLAPSRAWAATGDISWYAGHEDDETYTISDANDLAGLAYLVNSDFTDFTGKTIEFESALSGTTTLLRLSDEYTPIGTADNPFNGTFDGQGLSIMGFSITSGTDGLGLFGYAGEDSLIANVTIAGTISIEKGSDSTDVVEYVGGVVGCTQGSISNCTSSVKVNVVSAVAATEEEPQLIRCVGGIAGRVEGDIDNCTTTSNGSVYTECSSASVSSDIVWVVEYVGGIVGMHGPDADDMEGIGNPTSITDCDNAASVTILTYASGVSDRFGNPTNATGCFLGGVAGWSSGNIDNCHNTADVDSAYRDENGDAQNSYGTTATGGIVGALRVDEVVAAAGDTDDPGLRYNKEHEGAEPLITVSNCSNTGDVFGISQAGGIVGQAGSYTLITCSYNEGDVEGSRYTKPSPGGVAGRSYGDISYCYNTGDVTSTTGGGYYAAGIVGMCHSIGTDYDGNAITPEVYACYNTGYILTDTEAYRSGSIVGELDGGYIHDCFSLENRANTGSVSGLTNYVGTITDTVVELGEKTIADASTVALLNACADKDGWKVYYTLPEGSSWGDSKVHPVLVSESYSSASDLSKVSGATVTTTADAQYSASLDPTPTVSVTLSDGTELVQNADYRVVGQANTAGASVSSTTYQATIVGIGNYAGTLSQTAAYTITQGPISSCTVTAVSKYFNWEKQMPDTVVVYDSAGNVVDSSQYTWTVDEDAYNDASSGDYLNAQNQNQTEGYPVIVTAVEGGNYSGSQTASCFKIKPVQFASSSSSTSDNPNQDTFIIGDVVWGDETWSFEEVGGYSTTNAIGITDNRGKMKVKYTGSAIKPTITGITYMGVALKEITDGDAWYNNPTEWGYKLLYGNPNPELGSTTQLSSDESSIINVTGEDYAALTIRSAPYSNFDNYVTVWFEITPASIVDDVSIEGFKEAVAYNGDATTATQDDVVLTYNGMTLVEGTDFTVDYVFDTTTSTATVTYTGIGNYDGTLTKTYSLVESFPDVAKVTDANSWYYDAVYFVAAKGLMTGYDENAGDLAGCFGDTRTMTRAELATILWRYSCPDEYAAYLAAGTYEGTVGTTVLPDGSPISGIENDSWYTAAANWALSEGVMTGWEVSSGVYEFDPSGAVTFEQMATMMARMFAGSAAESFDTSELMSGALVTDYADVSEWARSCVAWSLDAGLFTGYEQSDGTYKLEPQENVLRGRIARVIYNAYETGFME